MQGGAADTSTTAPYENTAQNDCNGEEVAVKGTIHGTADDLRYYLRFHTTVNANGVPSVDRTESSIECR